MCSPYNSAEDAARFAEGTERALHLESGFAVRNRAT